MEKVIYFIQHIKVQLRWKMLIGFLLANVGLAIALIMAILTLLGNVNSLQNIKSSDDRSQEVDSIQATENQMVIAALDYGWTDNIVHDDEYSLAKSNLDRVLATFQPDPLQKSTFDAMQQSIITLTTTLDQVVSLNHAGQDSQAAALWRIDGSKQAANVKRMVQTLNDQEAHLALSQYLQIQDNVGSVLWVVRVLAVLGLALAVGLAILLTAAFTRPLVQLKGVLQRVAEGDLTQSVEIYSGDEFGELGKTYNFTVAALRQLVLQLYSQSSQVSAASQELSVQSRFQVTGSTQQANAITEATQALTELNHTADEIAAQAERAKQAVQESLLVASAVSILADDMATAQQQGRDKVASTIDSLKNLKNQIALIREQQTVLNEQSNLISDVVRFIDSIAKETHLLALNANIEAAGAGIYGARFAVIANQVKQLATRSMNATTQIQQALGGVGGSVQQVLANTEQALEDAEKAVSDANLSDEVLVKLATLSDQVKQSVRDIVGEVKGTVLLATNIGVATRQQQVASNQMLERMLEIETVTSQNLSAVRQGEIISTQLSSSALALKISADTFHLENKELLVAA